MVPARGIRALGTCSSFTRTRTVETMKKSFSYTLPLLHVSVPYPGGQGEGAWLQMTDALNQDSNLWEYIPS